MLPKIISYVLSLTPRKMVPIFLILSVLVTSCTTALSSTPDDSSVETPQTAVADDLSPTPDALESVPDQTSEDTAETFSSDQLGICFSYPSGYQQIPNTEILEIMGPNISEAHGGALFWLDISDSYDRTAERIALEEMNMAVTQQGVPPENLNRWTITLDGEQAVVLDGMPGQDLTRRVYAVHQQTLYILVFTPTLSENKVASDQMETLYEAITTSWTWDPCSASE